MAPAVFLLCHTKQAPLTGLHDRPISQKDKTPTAFKAIGVLKIGSGGVLLSHVKQTQYHRRKEA